VNQSSKAELDAMKGASAFSLVCFQVDGADKLLYYQEGLATWKICQAVIFQNSDS
jgi:hypothetical protein